MLMCSIHRHCEKDISDINIYHPHNIFDKFKNINQRFYFKNVCISHNDSNTPNLAWFKMNHLSFLVWRLLLRSHFFHYQIWIWKPVLKLFMFSEFIIYFSFSLCRISETFAILGLSWKSILRPFLTISIITLSFVILYLNFPAINVDLVSFSLSCIF